MKTRGQNHGFALIATLVLMALIVVVVVAYLGNTRSDRSTSSVYANRLRAKMIADSALTAATKLLHDNTKNGNYITAMPAPLPAPPPLRTELYRPDSTIIPDDFLQLNNAIGEVLASRVVAPPLVPPTSQVDVRPTATLLPVPAAGGSFGLVEPGALPSAADSFDFNQVVRVGNNNAGRLVDPDGRPAFGQWIRVRNSAGELIGRYAFNIEDESMKVNVNISGNNLGGGTSPNLRVNDLALPAPASTPASQIQEVDPAATLPASADRTMADNLLTAIGPAGSRVASKQSLGLLNEWQTNFSDLAHLLTVFSKDSDTTARGWKRMDLNNVVATSPDAVTAARRIADWIRDAWTGPIPLADFQEDAEGRNYQLYDDERLRLQIAANIVDYIDADNIPTDLSDVVPELGLPAIPVIGIERIPQLVAVMAVYQAKDRAPVPGASPARTSAKMSMKFRFNFINLFDTPLNLQTLISKIEVKGVPVITKLSEAVFDKSTAPPYSIPATTLTAVQSPGDIPPGQDGVSGSGVRTFETNWLVSDEVHDFRNGSGNPIFSPANQMEVTVFGPGDVRLDKTAMAWNDTPSTGYRQSGSSTPGSTSAGDFLMDTDTGTSTPTIPGGTRQIAAIFTQDSVVPSGSSTLSRQFGDPRYRPNILNERWRRQNRTDTESAFTSSALAARTDQVDMQPRTAGCDWYDNVNNRPLAFIRNASIRSIGELGHVAASEYPWRTLYLQHPERPVNSSSAIIQDEVAAKRRMGSMDWVLTDLFKTSDQDTRSGGININSLLSSSSDFRVLDSLFLGLPLGNSAAAPAPTPQSLTNNNVRRLTTDTTSALLAPISNRRAASGASVDNNPTRPFFQIGQAAPVLSRLFSLSTLVPLETRSTVTYSVLRSNPIATTEVNSNYRSDMHVEQAFREASNSITTRGDVFRVLYVGQSIRDIAHSGVRNGIVDGPEEISAEYLGEAFVERRGNFAPEASNPDAMKTIESRYQVLSNRVITE